MKNAKLLGLCGAGLLLLLAISFWSRSQIAEGPVPTSTEALDAAWGQLLPQGQSLNFQVSLKDSGADRTQYLQDPTGPAPSSKVFRWSGTIRLHRFDAGRVEAMLQTESLDLPPEVLHAGEALRKELSAAVLLDLDQAMHLKSLQPTVATSALGQATLQSIFRFLDMQIPASSSSWDVADEDAKGPLKRRFQNVSSRILSTWVYDPNSFGLLGEQKVEQTGEFVYERDEKGLRSIVGQHGIDVQIASGRALDSRYEVSWSRREAAQAEKVAPAQAVGSAFGVRYQVQNSDVDKKLWESALNGGNQDSLLQELGKLDENFAKTKTKDTVAIGATLNRLFAYFSLYPDRISAFIDSIEDLPGDSHAFRLSVGTLGLVGSMEAQAELLKLSETFSAEQYKASVIINAMTSATKPSAVLELQLRNYADLQPNEELKARSILALGRIGYHLRSTDSKRYEGMVEHLESRFREAEGEPKLTYLTALSGTGSPKLVPIARELQSSGDSSLKQQAALGLGNVGSMASRSLLFLYADDQDPEVRDIAYRSLRYGDPKAEDIQRLVQIFKKESLLRNKLTLVVTISESRKLIPAAMEFLLDLQETERDPEIQKALQALLLPHS